MSKSSFSGARAALAPGARVADRYILRRVLGEGGMGRVFEAEHEALGRCFALKVLAIEPWSEEILKRFQREARALARVTSPRVAQVTDFGVDATYGPFYVMELLDGETLQDRLDREQRLALSEALPIAVDLCEALAEVHAAGMAHRDLKPSNIGLCKSGPVRVKLLDFGLAALTDDYGVERITQSQQFVGTLQYMAPEQFKGAPPSTAIDVYALGVVLYELLVGRLPFEAGFAATLIQQHLFEPVPRFAAVDPDLELPQWLETIVMRLLEKDPARRFASPLDVARLLRAGEDGLAEELVITAPLVMIDTLPDGAPGLPPTRRPEPSPAPVEAAPPARVGAADSSTLNVVPIAALERPRGGARMARVALVVFAASALLTLLFLFLWSSIAARPRGLAASLPAIAPTAVSPPAPATIAVPRVTPIGVPRVTAAGATAPSLPVSTDHQKAISKVAAPSRGKPGPHPHAAQRPTRNRPAGADKAWNGEVLDDPE